jgi:hypothetical protein
MYGRGASEVDAYAPTTSIAQDLPSPETIEMWKATASSSDYLAPKAPI